MSRNKKSNREKKDKSIAKNLSEVLLSTPWGERSANNSKRYCRGNSAIQSGKYVSNSLPGNKTTPPNLDLNKFIENRSLVHIEYIRQAEATKRTAMIVGCLCIVASGFLLVFSPQGKDFIANIFGGVLLVVAFGAFGYGKFQAKTKFLEMSANTDQK